MTCPNDMIHTIGKIFLPVKSRKTIHIILRGAKVKDMKIICITFLNPGLRSWVNGSIESLLVLWYKSFNYTLGNIQIEVRFRVGSLVKKILRKVALFFNNGIFNQKLHSSTPDFQPQTF